MRVKYEAIAEGFTRIFLRNVANFSDKNALNVAVKRFCVNNFIWHVSTLGIPSLLFTCRYLWQHESRFWLGFCLSISRNRNQCIIPLGFAKLGVINMPIFTRAFFLRFPDHLIKLFEINYSFLDKLTHSQTQLFVSDVAGKYRGFIYAHNAGIATDRVPKGASLNLA